MVTDERETEMVTTVIGFLAASSKLKRYNFS